MVDTLSSLSVEAKEFYDRNLLYRARQAQIFYKAGKKNSLASREGNSVSWRRFNALPVNKTPLAEGVTPAGTNLSVTEVRTSVVQLGDYVTVSDALDLMGIDPVITESTDVMGQQGGESVESYIADVIFSGTNVLYATGSARSAISASNPFTLSLLRRAITNLSNNNAQPFGKPMENSEIDLSGYMMFIHPNVEFDLLNDTELKTLMQYNANNKILQKGYVGEIHGCQIMKSTLVPTYTGQGSGGANVYPCLLVAQHAFGIVDVAGKGKMEAIVKALGSGGTSDPLNQRATIGWKAYQAPLILNNNFMIRIEVGCTVG